MRKLITLMILVFGFFSISFAGTIPYTENINLKFNNVSGKDILGQGYNLREMVADTENVYYRNFSSGNKIFKKRINTNDVPIQLGTDSIAGDLLIDGQWLYYNNSGDGNKPYKINIDGTGRQKIGNFNSWDYQQDTNYIYYRSPTDGNSSYYRVAKDGTNINSGGTQVTQKTWLTYYVDDGDYFYYKNTSDGNKLYKIQKNGSESTSNGVLVHNDTSSYAKVLTIDNTYIYLAFSNGIYKIKKDGSEGKIYLGDSLHHQYSLFLNGYLLTALSDGTTITYYKSTLTDVDNKTKIFSNVGVKKVSIVGNNVFYVGGALNSGNERIYGIDMTNPQGFLMNDNKYLYNSNFITNGNNNYYINVNSTIPEGTNYDFYLKKGNNTSIYSTSEGSVSVFSNSVSLTYDNGNLGSLSVGDKIRLYNTYNEDFTVTITSISNNAGGGYYPDQMSCQMAGGYRDYMSWSCMGAGGGGGGGANIYFSETVTPVNSMNWGIEKVSTTSIKLNNSTLNGNTEINLNTVFGSLPTNFYYEVIITSTSNLLTPIISSVSVDLGVITNIPEVIPPDNTNTGSTNTGSTSNTGTTENVIAGGIDLGIGDGSNINIPENKQVTTFIQTIAQQESININNFSNFDKLEKFLETNKYNWKNHIKIGNTTTPNQTLYNVIDLGITGNNLTTLITNIANPLLYDKIVITEAQMPQAKIIMDNFNISDKDMNGNIIVSFYNSDTREYIFVKRK